MRTGSELLLEDQELSSGCAGFEGSATRPSGTTTEKWRKQWIPAWGSGRDVHVQCLQSQDWTESPKTRCGQRGPVLGPPDVCRSGEPAEEMEREKP